MPGKFLGKLGGPGVPELAPGFVHGNRGRIRKIKRPQVGEHRYAHRRGDTFVGDDARGQAGRFRPEKEIVLGLVGDFGEVILGMPGKSKDASIGRAGEKLLKIRVDDEVGEVVVVQAGAFEMGIGKIKTEGLNQVQSSAGTRR